MPRLPEVRERVFGSICTEGDSDAYNLKKRLHKEDNLRKRFDKDGQVLFLSLSGIQGALHFLHEHGHLESRRVKARRGDKAKIIYTPTRCGLRDYLSSPSFTWQVDIWQKLSQIAQLHRYILPNTLGRWSWFTEQQIDDIAVSIIEKWNLGRREEDPEKQFYMIAETGQTDRIILHPHGWEIIVEKVLTDEERLRWKEALQHDPELSARFPSTRKTYEPLTDQEKTRWLRPLA